MEYVIGIGLISVVLYYAFNRKQKPTLRETLEQELERRADEVEEIDVGTPQERYERAVRFWDSKISIQQEKAQTIYQRLIDEDVDYAPPYVSLGTLLAVTNPQKNSERVLRYFKRAFEIEPDNETYREKLLNMLLLHGKMCWDLEKNDESCRTYLDALNHYTQSGHPFDQSSPLGVRIAYRARRMFSKNAMDQGNNDLGVAFFDWCEFAGVDANEDIDFSDAAR